MRFEFRAWLTKPCEFHANANRGKHIPLRVMFGTILRETPKAYYIEVHGKPEPSSVCMHCGRTLTHKVSMFYGLGPECGKHYYISLVPESQIEEYLDEVRKQLAKVIWRGLVPKSAVKVTEEEFHTIVFTYQGKEYRVKTSDKSKVEQIYRNSTVLSDDISYA